MTTVLNQKKNRLEGELTTDGTTSNQNATDNPRPSHWTRTPNRT